MKYRIRLDALGVYSVERKRRFWSKWEWIAYASDPSDARDKIREDYAEFKNLTLTTEYIDPHELFDRKPGSNPLPPRGSSREVGLTIDAS